MTENINWRRRGACASPDQQPDMWFAPDIETRRLACHICLNHCPVLNECHEDAKTYLYKGVVAGGIIWSDANGRPVTRGRGPGQLCTICYNEIKKRTPWTPTRWHSSKNPAASPSPVPESNSPAATKNTDT